MVQFEVGCYKRGDNYSANIANPSQSRFLERSCTSWRSRAKLPVCPLHPNHEQPICKFDSIVWPNPFCMLIISLFTGPVAPPRSSPKKVVESSCSVTSQVVESTSSLKEANRNIKGLSSLVKEQNASSTSFKSKFGFKPGIFNNRNATSKNNENVTKVIESVDSLGRRVDKVSSLVRRGEPSQTRGQGGSGERQVGLRKESEYISSGDSNDSNLSGSSISSSASDSQPNPNLNHLVDCNSNTPPGPAQGLRGLPGPSVVPPAKPLRSAERRGLLPPPIKSPRAAAPSTVSSPKLRRSAGSPLSSPRSPLSSSRNPLSSPRSPRSPRPKPRLLPKPSCGPSPYRSLATTKAAPLVTSASGLTSSKAPESDLITNIVMINVNFAPSDVWLWNTLSNTYLFSLFRLPI